MDAQGTLQTIPNKTAMFVLKLHLPGTAHVLSSPHTSVPAHPAAQDGGASAPVSGAEAEAARSALVGGSEASGLHTSDPLLCPGA